MATPQPAILANLMKHQWYVHLSRVEGADLAVIKQALRDLRAACAPERGATVVHVCVLVGPALLADLTRDVPKDFQPYPGYASPDGKVAKATQGICCCGFTPTTRIAPGKRSTASGMR